MWRSSNYNESIESCLDISCQRYIGRGIITVNENGDPIGMTILLWNNNPLDGPRNVSNIPQYDHIGDGDYVHITVELTCPI